MQLAHNDNGTNEFLYLRIRRRRRRSLFRRFPWISSIKRIETVRIRIEIINWLVLSEKFVVNDLRRVDSSQNRLSRNKNRRRDEFLLCFFPYTNMMNFSVFFFFFILPNTNIDKFFCLFLPNKRGGLIDENKGVNEWHRRNVYQRETSKFNGRSNRLTPRNETKPRGHKSFF